VKHLGVAIGLLIGFVIVMSLIWSIGNVILMVAYFGFTLLGIFLWAVSIKDEIVYNMIENRKVEHE
jgi:hypothetical protein